MLKGFPTWNVPLAKTLNNIPPSVHENGLTDKKLVKHHRIDKVMTLDKSDFVLTCGKDGSVNVWNTNLKLACVGAHNFKSKLY